MMEAKRQKKTALEQAQLRAEFEAHPERYKAELPPVIVKTDAELKMDAAFQLLKAKLHQEKPESPAERAIRALTEKFGGA